jgi:hypothetical protein
LQDPVRRGAFNRDLGTQVDQSRADPVTGRDAAQQRSNALYNLCT